ncbi:MAG: DUF4177 domain-containing protein [Ignavibacteria bacterium]|nr:DUF4177 domain-containing protein [Ignavibacteria bacterium]
MGKKFEYKFYAEYIFTGEPKNPKDKKIVYTKWTEENLNGLGIDGWELISVVPQCHSAYRPGVTDSMLWIFKREV